MGCLVRCDRKCLERLKSVRSTLVSINREHHAGSTVADGHSLTAIAPDWVGLVECQHGMLGDRKRAHVVNGNLERREVRRIWGNRHAVTVM